MIKINPIQQKSKETPFFVWQNSWELRRYSDVPDNGPITTKLQRKLIHGYLASVSFIDEQVGRLSSKFWTNRKYCYLPIGGSWYVLQTHQL